MSEQNHVYEPSLATLFLRWLKANWHRVVVYAALGWLGYMQALDQENRALREEIGDLKVQVRVLQFKESANFGSTPEATIINFLDALPRPAWCKYVDRTGSALQFRMLHINPRYEFAYGITNERYMGQRDADVHPRADADLYLRNDMAVYESRGTVITQEPVSNPGGTETREFWKFYLKTRSDRDLICGIQVSE